MEGHRLWQNIAISNLGHPEGRLKGKGKAKVVDCDGALSLGSPHQQDSAFNNVT